MPRIVEFEQTHLGHFCVNLLLRLHLYNGFFTFKVTFLKELILLVTFLTFSVENSQTKLITKNLFCSTYFRSDFRQISAISNLRSSKIFEAVTNLFMKLQTSTLIKLDNLDIQLEVIEFQSRILWQFNSISNEK